MSLRWFVFALNVFLAINPGSAKRFQKAHEERTAKESAGAEPNTVMVFRVPKSWDDADLKGAFEPLGTVLSAHVVPKRGFGEVQFQKPSSVKKLFALSTQHIDEKTGMVGNHVQAGSTTLSVVQKQAVPGNDASSGPVDAEAKESSAKKTRGTAAKTAAKPAEVVDTSQSRRVYVGNIDWRTSWQDLKDHMRAAGEVAIADIFQEPDGRSKGCAIVVYKSSEDAQNAISTLNDSYLRGRLIFVREDLEASRTVYVGNIDWRVQWQDLKDHMRTAGEVAFVDIPEDSQGRSKGWAIVEYKSSEDAQNAVSTLNDSPLGGRMIFVREDHEGSRMRQGFTKGNEGGKKGQEDVAPDVVPLRVGLRDKGRLVYAGNLPWRVPWYAVKDLFKQHGEVIRVDMKTDENQRSAGYALVLYKTEEEAQQAVRNLNEAYFQGRRIMVRLDKYL